ncbi:hypothetical protein WA171_002458 [Blastocystis sp. BT1]
MRIAKRIARSSICSRREAERLIEQGIVKLNGVLVSSPAVNVTSQDVITIDGEELPPFQRTRVVLAYKLPGELVTKNDEKGRHTIFDRLKQTGLDCHIMPVGQLDYHTEGLLLLTNDGDYSRYLELPANSIPRRYRVQVYGRWDESRIAALRHSNIVNGVRYQGCLIKRDSGTIAESQSRHWCTIQVNEGKYHEVKILMGFVGLQVLKLMRTDFGAYSIGNLSQGEFREVRPIPLNRVKNIHPFSF